MNRPNITNNIITNIINRNITVGQGVVVSDNSFGDNTQFGGFYKDITAVILLKLERCQVSKKFSKTKIANHAYDPFAYGVPVIDKAIGTPEPLAH